MRSLPGPRGLPAPGSPGTIQRLQEGHRIGDFYMLQSAGVDRNGALLVYKKDGTIVPANQSNADDKQIVDNGLPRFTGSLSNTFSYKNWDLNIFLRGNFSYKLFNMQAFYMVRRQSKRMRIPYNRPMTRKASIHS